MGAKALVNQSRRSAFSVAPLPPKLDPSRKKRIDEKLDQLAAELKTPRLGFGKSMAILAAVLAAMGRTVTIAAEGRNAVAQIIRLIGEDKETEDTAAQRLAPPPRALPSPHPSKPPAAQQSRAPKKSSSSPRRRHPVLNFLE